MTTAAPEEGREFEVDVEFSGHPQVDAALERLAELPDRPLADHAEVYDDVHERLRGILSEPSEQGPGPGEPR